MNVGPEADEVSNMLTLALKSMPPPSIHAHTRTARAGPLLLTRPGLWLLRRPQRQILLRQPLILALEVSERREELPRLHQALGRVLRHILAAHKFLAAAKGALPWRGGGGLAGAAIAAVRGERVARHLLVALGARDRHVRARGRQVLVHLAVRAHPRAAGRTQLAVGRQVLDDCAGKAVGRQIVRRDGCAACWTRRIFSDPPAYAAAAEDVPALCSVRAVEEH